MIETGAEIVGCDWGTVPYRWEQRMRAHATAWCLYAAVALVGPSLLAGCGSPFEDTYAGTLGITETCPGSAPSQASAAVVLPLHDVGDTVWVEGVCPDAPVLGRERGSMAELGLTVCAPVDLGDGLTGTLTIGPSSHLSTAHGALAVALDAFYRIDADGSVYTGTATCTETMTGVLSPEGG